MEAKVTQYNYLGMVKSFIDLESKYPWFFSIRSGSRYIVGNISYITTTRVHEFALECMNRPRARLLEYEVREAGMYSNIPPCETKIPL